MSKEYLSDNFYLDEFKVSRDYPEIANAIVFTDEQKTNIEMLVKEALQVVRTYLGETVTILSGVRSAELNKKIKGSKTSDHMIGAAADITSSKIQKDEKKYGFEIWTLLKSNALLKQVIYYPNDGFIHISINTSGKKNKHEFLRSDNGKTYIKEG